VSPRRLSVVAILALAALLRGGPLRAQGTDTTAVPSSRGCTLLLYPRGDSTRMVSHRVGPDQYVTHVGGGLRWTCGSARMAADSGIKYDREQKLQMLGSVDYRDSVRTLTADSLTYWQAEDRVVAYGRVRLVRLASRSVLSGPRVEFFRSGGGPQRTVATGRPHLMVRDTTGKGPPAEIDADRMVFLGESEARLSGDVRIVRGKTTAHADSAIYLADAHEGRLLGSPEVTGEQFRLAGGVIAATIDSGKVRSVRARGDAEASGESFRLFSDAIDANVTGERIDRLWAYGKQPALALSASYRLDGDSLVFAFREGDIDSLVAIGGSSAVEVGDSVADALDRSARGSPPPAAAGDENWVRGDTLRLAFARPDTGSSAAASAAPADSVPAEGTPPLPGDEVRDDTTAAAPDSSGGGQAERRRRLERIRASGDARAYYLVPRDSAEGGGMARSYLIGREIVVFFAEGEARRVLGEDAIGVFLDPTEAEKGGSAPPDSSGTPGGGGS
jgi:hypothetical protein